MNFIKCYRNIADESDNQGVMMNKSKTKVMMENDTPIPIYIGMGVLALRAFFIINYYFKVYPRIFSTTMWRIT